MANGETNPETVDAYLAALPGDQQEVLEDLREKIKAAAPEVTEEISYQIPMFRLDKQLVGMSASKNHCSLHVLSPDLMATLENDLQELQDFTVSGATIQFTPEKPLPADLVEKIVDTRMQELHTK